MAAKPKKSAKSQSSAKSKKGPSSKKAAKPSKTAKPRKDREPGRDTYAVVIQVPVQDKTYLVDKRSNNRIVEAFRGEAIEGGMVASSVKGVVVPGKIVSGPIPFPIGCPEVVPAGDGTWSFGPCTFTAECSFFSPYPYSTFAIHVTFPNGSFTSVRQHFKGKCGGTCP